ncbi:MAG TPA: SPOR domain-containing protein [Candidatus Limnocylindrales bacterium]|nr:SPOR domain-containing protein [Candidatus Limnocylindrales bacterium]
MERYSDPQSFAREVNLPLIGVVHVPPVPTGAKTAALLAIDDPDEMKPVVDLLTQTRKSLTLRSLFMTGFPHDPEFFAVGIALARQWSRQGLKVAVVDLDFRHPTIVRPRSGPNEGFVDALEYGCSFQRIAWELVADAVWLVGSGSHPPDEDRFAAHPDWARVMRIFSARVDVTLYLAPFLDRKGFTGSLSKRMDGVLLAASVERPGRTALRDAFLELWGSDAPMIGCLGIAPFSPVSRVTAAPAPAAAAPPAMAAIPAAPERGPATAPPPAAPRQVAPKTTDWTFEPPAPPVAAPPPVRDSGETVTQDLVARLSEEVRRGQTPKVVGPSSRSLLLLALLLMALAGVGAFATYRALHRATTRSAATSEETLPAGTERILPADLGSPQPGGLPDTGSPPGEAGDQTAGNAEAPGTPSLPATSGETAVPVPVPEKSIATPPPAAKPPAQERSKTPYRVHIASFGSESKARDYVRGLRARGLDAWSAPAAGQPGWYRVFIGHYATHKEAAQKAALLLQEGRVERATAYPDKAR